MLNRANDEQVEQDESRSKGSAKGSGEHRYQLLCFGIPEVTIHPSFK